VLSTTDKQNDVDQRERNGNPENGKQSGNAEKLEHYDDPEKIPSEASEAKGSYNDGPWTLGLSYEMTDES